MQKKKNKVTVCATENLISLHFSFKQIWYQKAHILSHLTDGALVRSAVQGMYKILANRLLQYNGQ